MAVNASRPAIIIFLVLTGLAFALGKYVDLRHMGGLAMVSSSLQCLDTQHGSLEATDSVFVSCGSFLE